jgi:hypothetical protein
MKVMKQLLDFFDVKTVLSYARAAEPRTYLGPTLFPAANVQDLTFEYFKTLNRLPVMATIQAYGAETPIASREGIEKVRGEIPPIKRKINLNERYLIAIKREGLGDFELVRDKLFSDLDSMIMSVQDRIEALRMEAVSSGKLTISENGVIMTVDYGVAEDHKDTLETTALWTASDTATPIDNMQEWVQQIVDDTGIKPARALTSNTVVANLLKNEQIRELIHGSEGATRAVALSQLNNLLTAMDLPTIATYNVKSRVEAANGSLSTVRFFPEDKFVLLPEDPVGETLYGPTAEALLSSAGIPVTETAGLFAQVYGEEDPPALWTKVAATAIPTMPQADAIFIATVIELD